MAVREDKGFHAFHELDSALRMHESSPKLAAISKRILCKWFHVQVSGDEISKTPATAHPQSVLIVFFEIGPKNDCSCSVTKFVVKC
jgi:hypothetical protein